MRIITLIFLVLFTMCAEAQRYPPSGGGGCSTYSNQAALPGSATDGTCAVTLDAHTFWLYDLGLTSWLVVGTGGSTVTSLGAFGSSPNANGGSISSNVLTLQPADATHPGGVTTGSQTFGGAKTFSSIVLSTPLAVGSGGTGASSLANFTDSSAGADGITVTGGSAALVVATSIAQAGATGSQSGYLKSADWTTFNNKQAAGSYITALTGDVTASGPGSAVASLAATSNSTLATLSGLTSASALATVGTITSGTWNGTTVAINYGGTGQTTANLAFNALSPMTTLGDIEYENSTPIGARLAGNTTSTKEFLTQTGTGSVSAAPAWGTIANTDLSGITNTQLSGSAAITNANLATMAANTVKANITGSPATPTDSTLTALIDADIGSTQGDILYRGSSAWSVLAPGTSGFALTTGGASANPSFSLLSIAGGGTGQTTANNALNALLPSQTGDSGLVLGTNGTNSSWVSPPAGTKNYLASYTASTSSGAINA